MVGRRVRQGRSSRPGSRHGEARGTGGGGSTGQRCVPDAPATIAEHREQTALVHCLFGNPFRPRPVCTAWLTREVSALADGIYAERAFDRMPLLADAVEALGCTNADLIEHCRFGREHARGCWVVDLLLGKS